MMNDTRPAHARRLEQCPLCEEFFPVGQELEQHADRCLRRASGESQATPPRNRSSYTFNQPDGYHQPSMPSNQYSMQPSILPQSSSSSHHQPVPDQSHAPFESMWTKQDLDEAIGRVRETLKLIRVKIRKAPNEFHRDANDSYQRLADTLLKFHEGLNTLRREKNLPLQNGSRSSQRSSFDRMSTETESRSNALPPFQSISSPLQAEHDHPKPIRRQSESSNPGQSLIGGFSEFTSPSGGMVS
eukprot:137451_1